MTLQFDRGVIMCECMCVKYVQSVKFFSQLFCRFTFAIVLQRTEVRGLVTGIVYFFF